MSARARLLLVTLLLTALWWGPAAAHLLELPSKMQLGRDDYLTVQQIYSGWALSGVIVIAALLACAGLVWVARGTTWFAYALAAFLSLVVAHALFWAFTFPANRATANWTTLPASWASLRVQWEYSHAAAAGLTLLALLCLILAATRMLRGAG